MNPFRRILILGILLSSVGARAEEIRPPAPVAGEVIGRVLLRATGVRGQVLAKPGAEISVGAAVVTGRQSRAELRAGTGLWRIGALAVWQAEADGARLLSGSALAVVPSGVEWRVESLGGRLRLGTGIWMLTAVENAGLKIVCLEASGRVSTELEAGVHGTVETEPSAGKKGLGNGKINTLRLRAGDLVFLRPAGKGFGPVVSVFLEELLATSRLVNGFSEPLPEMDRLRVVASAQSERLKGVTNALVAGAVDDKSFQVVVPREPAK